jgi:tRNA(fMet)-specific endonuclease VapC
VRTFEPHPRAYCAKALHQPDLAPARIATMRDKLQELERCGVDQVVVVPFDAQAAQAYGPIRAAYKERNRDALDKLIASHAVALDVTLVTNNEADFVNYAGLVVENWVNNH